MQSYSTSSMSRSQRHKRNKRAQRIEKAAAEKAVTDEKFLQNSRRPLLKIPTELRLKIYDYVMESVWQERREEINRALGAVHSDDNSSMAAFLAERRAEDEVKAEFAKKAVEPALLRVCRAMRDEGMKTFFDICVAEKQRLTVRGLALFHAGEEVMMDAPMVEWEDDDAESMAIALDFVPDIERQLKRMRRFGLDKVDEKEKDKQGYSTEQPTTTSSVATASNPKQVAAIDSSSPNAVNTSPSTAQTGTSTIADAGSPLSAKSDAKVSPDVLIPATSTKPKARSKYNKSDSTTSYGATSPTGQRPKGPLPRQGTAQTPPTGANELFERIKKLCAGELDD